MRRTLPVVLFLIVATVAWWLWPRVTGPATSPGAAPNTATQTSPVPAAPQQGAGPGAGDSPALSGGTVTTPTPPPVQQPPSSSAWREEDFPIIAPLNKPGSTIVRDLDAVNGVLEAWRSNFPREGNPVGENADITAALTGANHLELVLIPKKHPAINAQGELCDRWGTPFRFHQLSGEQMEIRSAGPDRTFATGDDAIFHP